MAAILLACFSAHARQTQINVEVMGGYGLMTASDWDASAYERIHARVDSDASDDSFLRPGPALGLGMTFRPQDTFVHFLYGFDALVARSTGTLRGRFQATVGEMTYDRKASLDTGQFDLLLGVGFGRAPFVPYLMAGLGVAVGWMDVENEKLQQSTGVAVHAVAGGDYYVLKWLSIGLQLRFTDLIGQRFFVEVDPQHTVRLESRIYPLQATAKIGFHF
jgi:hypothetical protein